MIHALVDLGDRVVPLKGKDFKELKERTEKAQSALKKDKTTYVMRSGERIELPSEELPSKE